ncbi:3-dehydroquinate synthase [Planctomycetales bacterium]|nr:3-dehydroquinate synthase [Planctomycetales bacterium]GHT37881.1 3-dehydroquinate synthase [Planctomycetales bacterium]
MQIPVPLNRHSYNIEIGSGILASAGKVLSSLGTEQKISKAVIITDANVQKFGYTETVYHSIQSSGLPCALIGVEAGEQSKSIHEAVFLWESLLELGADRKTVVITVGGGVVGDLAGFAAATFARGIRFFQIPTTLLAQVDSSVGGKVGIDLPTAKNMVGAFHQPLGVLADVDTLQTLPKEQYFCGLGEVVKYAVSLDAGLFRFLKDNAERINCRDKTVLQQIIADCCRIKAAIVAEDERETTGKRALLNYGHTFGHAFEIMSDFTLLHGKGVVLGSICAAKLAVKLGMIGEDIYEQHLELFRLLNLPSELPADIDWDKCIALMRHDKKAELQNTRCSVKFVLPDALGHCVLKEMPLEEIIKFQR